MQYRSGCGIQPPDKKPVSTAQAAERSRQRGGSRDGSHLNYLIFSEGVLKLRGRGGTIIKARKRALKLLRLRRTRILPFVDSVRGKATVIIRTFRIWELELKIAKFAEMEKFG